MWCITQDAKNACPAIEAPMVAGWAALLKEKPHLLGGISQANLYLCWTEHVILEEAHCKQCGTPSLVFAEETGMHYHYNIARYEVRFMMAIFACHLPHQVVYPAAAVIQKGSPCKD